MTSTSEDMAGTLVTG